MLPEAKILKLFGPKAKYPHGGEHKLLMWYEHNEGNHILVAKTEKALLETWVGVYAKEDGGLEPKEFWDVTIVDPPASIIKDIAMENYRRSVDWFKWYIYNHVASEVRDQGKPLRPGFWKCTDYKCRGYEEGDEDWDDRPTEEDDPNHGSCANCREGLNSSYPFETNHDLLIDWWMTESPERHYSLQKVDAPHEKPVFSEGREGALHVVSMDSGHHRPGVGIKESNSYYNDEGQPHFPKEILFWFQGIKRDRVPKDFVEITKIWEKGRKQRQKETFKKYEDEKRARERKELAVFEAVLAGKDPRTVL